MKYFIYLLGVQYSTEIPEQTQEVEEDSSESDSDNELTSPQQNDNTSPERYKLHPWITKERRCSAQQPFESLFGIQGSPAPRVTIYEDSSTTDGENQFAKNNFPSSTDLPSPELNQGDAQIIEEDVDCVNATPNQVDFEKREVADQLRYQVEETKMRFNELCHLWNERVKDGIVPHDENRVVATVVLQTEQLQRERFNQFSDFIVHFQNDSEPKKILKSDLKGLWETISLQACFY